MTKYVVRHIDDDEDEKKEFRTLREAINCITYASGYFITREE